MIEPFTPRSIMLFATIAEAKYGAFRLMAHTVSNSSSESSSAGLTMVSPALFTSTSMRPNSVSAASTKPRMLGSCTTSSVQARARTPSSRQSAATRSHSATLRLPSARSAPACAQASAMALPIPRLAPVIITALRFRSKLIFSDKSSALLSIGTTSPPREALPERCGTGESDGLRRNIRRKCRRPACGSPEC